MTAIGETLRRERLRRNIDLETISGELKISSKFLEAIEDEKFDRLPGGVFAKSFVRQYAHLLGLDEEEMANEVQRQTQPADAPQFVQNVQNVKPSTQPIVLPKVEAWESVGESRFHISSSLHRAGVGGGGDDGMRGRVLVVAAHAAHGVGVGAR